jgi:S-adenosylmethionine-diacylglycerol 3-amino-3-carboxypropyl transferase
LANELLCDAVHASSLASGRGLLERLFTLAFSGLVYPQIWEDPAVDVAALGLGPEKRIVTIASGGCNVMNYLASNPEQIVAVDLNPAHVALLRLKLAAIRALPTHEQFFRFFGHADETANVALYDRFVAPALDPETRRFWEAPRLLGGRRIDLFARNLYRFGLLGRFIGAVHLIARLYGRNPRRMLEAESLADQRRLFEETLAPVFDTRLIRWLSRLPVSLYGLGIPPAQYARLAAASGGDMAGLLRGRLEKLACDFPLDDNYFAWQAFGRGYDRHRRRAVPPYLARDNWETVRANAARATVHHASLTDHLALQPEADLDGYVLLDAQDWMTAEQMRALWQEITRTARPGARVIFRTAGDDNPVPAILPTEIADAWVYEKEASAGFTAHDRSSIYGAFHLMRFATR